MNTKIDVSVIDDHFDRNQFTDELYEAVLKAFPEAFGHGYRDGKFTVSLECEIQDLQKLPERAKQFKLAHFNRIEILINEELQNLETEGVA